MKTQTYKFYLLFFLFENFFCYSQESFVLKDSEKEISVKEHFLFFEDRNDEFSGNDIGKAYFEEKFANSTKKEINFGYTSSVVWVKINLENQSDKNWLLEIDNPNLDEIEFFLIQNQQIISHFVAGDHHPIETYPLKDRNPIFPLKVEKNKKYNLYLKGKSTEELGFNPTFYESNAIINHLSNRNLLWGIFFGFVLVISFYNFFLWLTIRDKTYLFYIIYVLAFGLFQFSLYGFGFQYAWGNGIFNEKARILFLGISVTFLTIFSIHFLEIYRILPNSRRFFYILGIFWLFVYILMVFTFSHKTTILLIGVSIFGLFFQFYFSIKLLLNGNKSVRYYLLATIAFTISVVIILLKSFVNFFPGDFYLKLGSMVEMVLFSVALGEKYRFIKIEQIRQQKIRNEIASSLHDDLAASLSSLTMFSELNRIKTAKKLPENVEVFENISRRSREMMKQVREAVWEINPSNDESEEWTDRMINYARETLDSKQIDLKLSIEEKIKQLVLPIDIRRNVYLFFKEAINNVAKYSEAETVEVNIYEKDKKIYLEIKDNGIGFDENQIKKGNGLLNFEKRTNELKGKLEINSSIGNGTKILLVFPF